MTRVLVEIPLDRPDLDRVAALPGVTVQQLPSWHESHWDLPADMLSGPEVLLCKYPPRNHDDMPDLKWIQIGSVGYEHLKEYDFANRSIRVTNARGIFDSAIAEWNVGMMIALTRDFRGLIRNQEHGIFDPPDRFSGEVRDRVVGLWGYGGIGRETARLAKALGMTVHTLTRSGIHSRAGFWSPEGTGDPEGRLPDRVFTPDQRLEFLAGLDFLILALPRTRDSDGMIGAAELKALPRHAHVLNPARGPIIQQEALLEALRRRWIAGAAIDTHYQYPLPPDHPLWRFPNVILSPHVSGADRSERFRPRIAALFVENLRRFLAGQPLWNELTRQEWLDAG